MPYGNKKGAGEDSSQHRGGEAVGFYGLVVTNDQAAGRAALDRLGEEVAAFLARTGLTEDDLVAALARAGDDGD